MIHSFSKKISTYLIRAGLPSEKYSARLQKRLRMQSLISSES